MLQKAIQLDPNNPAFYAGRGAMRLNLGDRPGAIADLQRGADLAKAQGDDTAYTAITQELSNLQQ
jgi:regulator of sirC expression with transglutaminase-like and TPR domain